MIGPWLAFQQRRRFAILFVSLLFCILAGPIATALGLGRYPVEAFLALSLIAASIGGAAEGRWRALAALTALFVVARALQLGLGAEPIPGAGEIAWAGAAAIAAVAALRAALAGGVLTVERIYAALCVYLLAGLVFGVLYHVLERLQPGSLRVMLADAGSASDLGTAIYFSFATLTTLGYGDVVAVTPVARALVTCEAVGGQLFVAVLIARLVSLHAHASK